MHQGNESRTEKLSYTLKGSNDGTFWDTLHTGVKEATIPVAGSSSVVFHIEKQGE